MKNNLRERDRCTFSKILKGFLDLMMNIINRLYFG